MEIIGWFVFDFVLIILVYYILFVRRTIRGEKVPTEANYLINLYKLDVNLFSYRKFIKTVWLVTSFDVALVATIVAVADTRIIWQVLFGFVAVIPVVVLSFLLLGKYYQKKQTKDNSKELEKEKKYLEKVERKDKKKLEKLEKKKAKRRLKYVK